MTSFTDYAAGTSGATYQTIIRDYLHQWGLDSLIPYVTQLGQDSSNDATSINLKLQQTDAWQQRFAGNQARIANGLGVLDPATYIATEAQYKDVLRQYGLPSGFYDDKSSLDSWIGMDVSPSEISDRAKIASDTYLNAPKAQRDLWDQWYGHAGPGGAIAAILDPTKAQPLIEQMATTVGIGGAARAQGLSANQAMAARAAQQGVTIDSARAAYSTIAQRMGADTASMDRFFRPAGTTPTDPSSATQEGGWGQSQEEQAFLLNDGASQTFLSKVGAAEGSLFDGHGGASTASNNQGSNY